MRLVAVFSLCSALCLAQNPPHPGGGGSSGPAGGDLSGTYPNPAIATGKPLLNNLGNPGASKTFAMGSNFLTFSFGTITASDAPFVINDTTGRSFDVNTNWNSRLRLHSNSNIRISSDGDTIEMNVDGLGGGYAFDVAGSAKAVLLPNGDLSTSSASTLGTAPSVGVTGVGCSLGSVTGNNIAGKIAVTGTGVACVITLTWSNARAFTNGSVCGPLIDRNTGVSVQQGGDTTTTAFFPALAISSGDTLTYGACIGVN